MRWHAPKSSKGIQEENWPNFVTFSYKWPPILKTGLLTMHPPCI